MTAEAFAGLRRFSPALGREKSAAIAADLLGHRGDLVNDFEEGVFERLPRLRTLRDGLLEAGAEWAGMSGSGSTIVGAFRSAAARDAARARFSGLRAEPAGCVARTA